MPEPVPHPTDSRRPDHVRFKEAWATVQGLDAGRLKVGDIDQAFHTERVAGRGANRIKPTFTATFGSIPDGLMYHRGEGYQVALLKWRGRAWVWSPETCQGGPWMDQGQGVEILTPRTVVDVIGVGFMPGVHGSVEG